MEEFKVNCYSGHTYAERPESFEWQGIDYKVERIEKAWQEADRRCFQVSTSEYKLFNLCYNETQHRWSLIQIARS